MAETLTSRFGLVQWGVGTDSPSRIDFNAAFLSIEQKAAYDDGVTRTALPTTNLVAGRSALVAPESSPGVPTGYRTLYRRNDAAGWDYAGGNTISEPFNVRAANGVGAGGPARSANAFSVSHPDAANPGAQWAWDGSAILGGTQRVYDYSDPTKGTLIVGAVVGLAADPIVNGRVHVRTRATGERGIVLRPYTPVGPDTGSGALLAVQEATGNDLFLIDAQGRVRHQTFSAWGGAALPTTSVMAISPTSNAADAVVNGLLLYGQAGVGATTKRILQVARDGTADVVPILTVDRDNIAVGRLPWGSLTADGSLSLSGRQLANRATGYTADAMLWKLTRADAASPDNAGLDEPVASLSRTSGLTRVPMTLTQALGTGSVNLTLKRYTDLTARFEVIGAWDSVGSVIAGARWRGSGTLRDARQGVKHRSIQFFGSTLTTGQTLSTTWATMTVHSVTTTDLDIAVCVEATINPGAFSDKEDGQQWFLYIDLSVNGGAFNQLVQKLQGGPSHRDGSRPVNVQTDYTFATNVPAGATFAVRTRIVIGGAVPSVVIRAVDVMVQESIIESY
jgi:hypothetical protein